MIKERLERDCSRQELRCFPHTVGSYSESLDLCGGVLFGEAECDSQQS